MVTFVSATDYGYNNLEKPTLSDLTAAINYTQVNVNNSLLWDGHSWSEVSPWLYNQSYTGETSLLKGSVIFSNGSNFAEDNSNLFWDDTNNRLGIGTTTPKSPFHVTRTGGGNDVIIETTDASNADYRIRSNWGGASGTSDWAISALNTPPVGGLGFYSYTAPAGWKMTLTKDGELGIGVASPAHTLDVLGDAHLTGNITSANVFIPQYMFAHTNENVSLAGAGVWKNITFAQEDSDIKMGISHTYNDNTNDTFTFADSGVYEIKFDLDVTDTSVSSSDIDVAGRVIYINGTEIVGSNFESDIAKRGLETELSHSFLVRLNTGASIKVQFIADNGNVKISTHGTFGDHPESASIVIKKVANL